MAEKVTIEEWAEKMRNEGGFDGMWDWGGTDFLTTDKKFNDAWKRFGRALEEIRGMLPENDED